MRAWALRGGFCLVAGGAVAQPQTPASSAPADPGARPGMFRAGPVWITPRFRLGALGLDTNVFYAENERQTDFTASGGPALEVLLPLRAARLIVRGGLNYLYFARTASQRRLTGDALARFELGRGRVRIGVFESYDRRFERPSYEVTTRLESAEWTTGGDLGVDFSSRVRLLLRGHYRKADLPAGQLFLGVDLSPALVRNETHAAASWRFGLTPKTWFLLDGEARLDRHPLLPVRDGDTSRLSGGLELVSPTRLDGRALVGVVRFEPKDRERWSARTEPFVSAALGYRFGPRTRLWVEHRRDLSYSAFTPVDRSPTLDTHSSTLGLEKGFGSRVDLRSFGTYAVQRSDGAILRPGQAASSSRIREDEVWEAGANLGYLFGSRLRIGVGATYTDRRSTFADFGIRGLVVGGTVSFNPN
jgi:Putative beta-barrel porin 2